MLNSYTLRIKETPTHESPELFSKITQGFIDAITSIAKETFCIPHDLIYQAAELASRPIGASALIALPAQLALIKNKADSKTIQHILKQQHKDTLITSITITLATYLLTKLHNLTNNPGQMWQALQKLKPLLKTIDIILQAIGSIHIACRVKNSIWPTRMSSTQGLAFHIHVAHLGLFAGMLIARKIQIQPFLLQLIQRHSKRDT